SWDFGDGETSTEQNPTHTYNDEGIYSVRLLIKHLNDSSEINKEDLISVYEAFGASFTTDKTTGVIPLTINFTDNSFGSPTTWSWDFGDGTTSTEQNPSHIYTVQGIYNVSLTVSDGNQQSTKTRVDFISAYRNTAVDDESDGLIGLNVYPNPFSTSTAIYYELLSPAHVSLRIYDLMGNVVSSLVDESQADGRRVAVWNGFKNDGTKANTGLYFYRFKAGSKTFTGKLILY
ncbi:MAG: PKD domain-containing protein, partial [Bacteroidetes bacterium]|nr:PKD domain-containing protein [Bacteroidota bacterium]